MKQLTYTKRTSLVLHTEDYSNAGLKQDDIMKAIEKINGVWMVERFPINSNVLVHVEGHSDKYIKEVFAEIHYTLESILH